jgi:hypothetical protein
MNTMMQSQRPQARVGGPRTLAVAPVLVLLLHSVYGIAAPPATNQAANGTPSAPAAATAPAAARTIPQSVFVYDLKGGRDPFFPDSARRQQKAPAPAIAARNASEPAASKAAGQLRLKGISGSRAGRLALINNRTFAAGETGEVRTGEGRVHLRCVEIRDDAVVVLLGGESQNRELRLHEKL